MAGDRPQNTGLLPGAFPFATRTALSFLIAYFVAFSSQVQAASTTGVCVAIIAQPSATMTVAKASWRLLGTLMGGIAGVALVALFPQDRTLLLVGYALWLGLCAFAAGLLRDFRAYGAVLSGYTAGVVALGVIDAPQTALPVALDRVAAMVIGVASVTAINLLLGRHDGLASLLAELRDKAAAVTSAAADALSALPHSDDHTAFAASIGFMELRTAVMYAGSGLPDGPRRRSGACRALAALIAMSSASKLLQRAMKSSQPPEIRTYLQAAGRFVRGDGAVPPEPVAADPVQHMLLRTASELMQQRAALDAGLLALGGAGGQTERSALPVSFDFAGAGLGAVRAVVAVGLCSLFSVLAGWGGATLVLIQSSAIIALLGTLPNPAAAARAFPIALVPTAIAVGLVNFLILPGASGFVPFALVIGSLMWVAALTVRHTLFAPYAPATLLLTALLLGPSNQQSSDFATYANTVLQIAVDLVFVVLSFRLIPAASHSRRRSRVAAEITGALRRTLSSPGRTAAPTPPGNSAHHDRMARALAAIGEPTPVRLRQLRHLHHLGELDALLRRALFDLSRLRSVEPALSPDIELAERSLQAGDPTRILHLAHALSVRGAATARPAVASMAAMALHLRHDPSSLRFFHLSRE